MRGLRLARANVFEKNTRTLSAHVLPNSSVTKTLFEWHCCEVVQHALAKINVAHAVGDLLVVVAGQPP